MWYIQTIKLLVIKKWSTDICNIDKTQKHYAKSKKLDMKGQILYYLIYIKYPE